jgi:aspartate-semialdehyde dehydrogenase
VGILGATGTVGQKLVRLVHEHADFDLVWVAASARSAGRPYAEAARWREREAMPPAAAAMEVRSVDDELDCELCFSALDAATAAAVEPRLAAAGIAVVSNASALRMHPQVPLVVPEVNPDHLDLLASRTGGGFVVTNPNCATVGLVMALRPLVDRFGVEAVSVTTLQAVSGAGYPGVPALDVVNNVIPHIGGEERKLEEEPGKILGRLHDGVVRPLPLTVSAQACRVAVEDGHVLCVSLRLGRRVGVDEALAALRGFASPIAALGLPSAPPRPLCVIDQNEVPQPRLHVGLGGGMTVSVGRVRRCPLMDLRMVVLVHNTMRGAAGAALLNAELLVARGMVGQRA